MTIRNPILPSKQIFVKKNDTTHSLNLEAICIFVATGFFMNEDTYWRDLICLSPAHNHELDAHGCLIKSTPNFKWHYSPRDISFETALEEYVLLLTKITKEQIGNSRVILPLSGGLDSRSQALVLKQLDNPVQAFSYAFQDGFREDHIAKKIAKASGFEFNTFSIKPGYLWPVVEDLAEINGCYSEFTHPRQMAVLPELKQMKGVFSLGHWGDVLFDRGVPEGTQESEISSYLLKKMVKPAGLELAEHLWRIWELEGDFKTYLVGRIESALSDIKIDNVSAKVRAFKTTQWAHRWTTTNLSVFEAAHPIAMPYYDDRMCEFICGIPEEFLADRRLQIAHLKQDSELANIAWQDHYPFNLNNYSYNRKPYNLPYRIWSKLKRVSKGLTGHPYIQRNWELQFRGLKNEEQLEKYLFNSDFNQWIPKEEVSDFYQKFQNTDGVHYSHAVSMLLTLSVWHHQNKDSF